MLPQAGVYRDYKGKSYRVLFLTTWSDEREPSTDADVYVTLQRAFMPLAGFPDARPPNYILARWSGNTNAVKLGDHVVVYVALYDEGRVSMRTVAEFEQRTGGDIDVARFEYMHP